jgi:exosortase
VRAAAASVADPAPALPEGRRTTAAVAFVSLGLLFVAFGPAIADAAWIWWNDPDYGHGLLLPPFAAFLLWQRRRDLAALEPRPTLLGPLLLFLCLPVLWIGELDYLSSLRPYALVGSLGALTLSLYGRRGLSVVFPALLVLFLACPLPDTVESWITVPLKQSATLLAAGLLDVVGIPSSLEGAFLHVAGAERLWIADACSGIRSLMALTAVAVIGCLFWRRHWLVRVVVVLSAVPIAVLVNGLRIGLTGWLSAKVGPEAATGFFHTTEGFLLFVVGAALLLAWAAVLGALFRRPA